MARAVFRPNEVEYVNGKVVLQAPFPEPEADVVEVNLPGPAEAERYTGPSADDLRREAENFKAAWAREKTEMAEAARAQADAILEDARERARTITENAEKQAADIKSAGAAEAERVKAAAEKCAQETAAEAARQAEQTGAAAREEGLARGKDEGFTQGMAEVQRLVARAHLMLERIQDKREAILNDAEQQMIDMTLLIARKVVKTISAAHKEVVTENIREALTKVKSRGNILIKVNLSDLELSSQRIDEFTRMVEGGGTIQVQEDSTIDPGGCVIETDFGEIDARIANQFEELEAKIVELSPIKKRAR
jgi:flagellar assembly protein FliH